MQEKFPLSLSRAAVAIAFGVLVLASAADSNAADVVAQSSPATKAPKPPKAKPMTRDQLRACMDKQDRVKAMRDQLLKEQASLDQQRNEVARMDAELEKRKAALDPADAEGAKALTEDEARRNAASDAFNARLPPARELNANYGLERQSWVDGCADKDYDANDEAAIMRERQRAAKAAGSTK